MLTIDLLRHGELVGGVKYRGIIDDPLTELGRSSMDNVWSNVRDNVSTIFSSPLQRCAVPASDWANDAEKSLHIDSRLQELYYGDWEGKTPEQIKLTDCDLFYQWRTNPDGLSPPNGESMSDFSSRVSNFFDELRTRHQEDHILIVSHSGVIRTMLALALAAPVQTTRHLSMPYACWSRITIDDSGMTALQFHAAGTSFH